MFFAYGLIHTFIFFPSIIYHNKNYKKYLQKKHKKMWEKVFKILFYFLKMDKNNCPKMFLHICTFKMPIIYTRSYFFLHKGQVLEPNTLPGVVSDNSIDKCSSSLCRQYCCG